MAFSGNHCLHVSQQLVEILLDLSKSGARQPFRDAGNPFQASDTIAELLPCLPSSCFIGLHLPSKQSIIRTIPRVKSFVALQAGLLLLAQYAWGGYCNLTVFEWKQMIGRVYAVVVWPQLMRGKQASMEEYPGTPSCMRKHPWKCIFPKQINRLPNVCKMKQPQTQSYKYFLRCISFIKANIKEYSIMRARINVKANTTYMKSFRYA